MKNAFGCFFLCCLFFLCMTASAFAEDLFDISYEKMVVSSDEDFVSCRIIFHIVNISSQDVKDVVASVSGMNDVTYDNHTIMIGSLVEGQPFGTLDEFTVPAVMTKYHVPEGQPVIWLVEYTDPDGVRQKAEVGSRAIQ